MSPVFGSETDAVFESTVPSAVPAFTLCVKVRTCWPPAGNPEGHVMVLPDRVQDPAGPVDETRTGVPTPLDGKVSVTTSGFASVAAGPSMSPGPMLVTVIVHVTVSPCATPGLGLATFVIARS